MDRRGFLVAGVAAGVLGVPVGFAVLFGAGVAASGASCDAGVGVSGALPEFLDTEWGRVDQEQLSNAALIAAAAQVMGLPAAGQVLGIQCALGESGLRVLDRGDAAGPDSRGLFQQRGNGAWGSLADRMDPTISATNFFKALQKVDGWEAMEPSWAINRVQRNSDRNHYTRFRASAQRVFEAVTGGGAGLCVAGGGQVVGDPKGQWVFPLDSPSAVMTSPYGWRGTLAGTADINGGFHYGVDLSAAGAPQVLAPTDMRITRAQPASQDVWGAGENVAGTSLDGQYSFGLFHMVAGSCKVRVGDVVAAGTPLGLMGSTGNVSGPHVHVEIYSPARDNPVPASGAVDPVPILRKAGAWR
ncbi:M23 family metallopeptidase [Acaricomes phytoseiuli]|uniref:M23 family metallopeptidase n=1 Tax=Acaricomes phytoseiuli TaxID=291968 RepID=UPI0005BAA9A9|nr:M23 family metallopeptidase [Acaricomes phytoseiuli]